MKKEMKAISTLFVILLILCSLIVGALISYMWVMASYYNMPQDSTELAVEDIHFSVTDFSYFGLTVLNPSNSALDVNITGFNVKIESKNETLAVGNVEPTLPCPIKKGTRQTFKCIMNWGGFAGETIEIEPIAANASIRTPPYNTPKAQLTITPTFDATSVAQFNLMLVNSAESVTNLTISEIKLFRESINVTPALPYVLAPSWNVSFACERNWEDLRGQNVTITVETVEGFEMIYVTDRLPSANVYIDQVGFNYSDTSYFNTVIRSSEDSTTTVKLTRMDLTLANGTTITPDTSPKLSPLLPYFLVPNGSLTVRCLWNWNANRNETIVVSAYTKEGFTISNNTATTPTSLIWNITDVKFDLAYKDRFSVNVTNLPTSLQDLNITQIKFNENDTLSSSQIIPSGESWQFNCTINWKDFIGKNVTITAYDSTGQNNSESIEVPLVSLKIVSIVFDDAEGSAEVKIMILNSASSTKNVTINSISIETTNTTTLIAIGPRGRPLNIGVDPITISCPYNWHDVSNQQLKVTIETVEQITISQSIQVP